MKIYVHIGLNKTGTSAIQAFLLRHPEFLAQNGFIYPKAGRESKPAHHDVAGMIRDNDKEGLKKFAESLKKEVLETGLEKVIISSELFHTVSPKILREVLPSQSVTPIIYVRNHIDYLNSWYRQGVKGRLMCSSFDDFAFVAKAHFYPILSSWSSVFGGKIIIRKYGKGSLINDSSLDQFIFDVLELGPDKTESLFKQVENISIGGNLLFVKRLLNNFVNYKVASSEEIQSELLHIAQEDDLYRRPVKIRKEVIENLQSIYVEDCTAVRNKFKIDIFEPENMVDAFPSPNLETFDVDKEKIMALSLEKSFTLGTLVQRHLGGLSGNKE
jgi:hypothetical protein